MAFSIEQKRQALLTARLQMKWRDFIQDATLLSSLTVADLMEAQKKEENHEHNQNICVNALRKHFSSLSACIRGSDRARALYRGQIWGTCLQMGGPSLWMTINPCDLHDPIVQVFAGEEIDMDCFDCMLGPDSRLRAFNVARDPYVATKFFFFIIQAALEQLFGIYVTRD